MENNDKLIKDLLKEGFLTEAPEGFTEKVMSTLAETEKSKVHFPVLLTYFLLFAGAMAVAVGSIYLTNKSLLVQYYEGFASFFSSIFVSSFYAVSHSFSFLHGAWLGYAVGIAMTIGLLLLLDRLVFSKKQEMNMLI